MIGLSPLPTAHPNLFQQKRVRASTRCYPSFTLAMGRSLRFRVCGRVLTSPCSDSLSLRLRLSRDLTSHVTSNSPDHNAKGTQSGDHSPSYRLQAHGFRICFTRRQAFFSPFPHGTGALSVTDEYSALEGGPPRFRRDSSCPAVLRYPDHPLVTGFAYGALTLSGGPFQAASATDSMQTGQCPIWTLQPRARRPGLGSSPFARRYWGNLV